MKLLVALAAISAASAQTIPEVAISQAPEFTTLVAALTAADLVDTLSGDGPFTVFAPTNAAFDKLPAGTVDTLLLPENKDDLIAVLTYHVVPGKIMSTDLSDGQKAETLQGEEVTITIADGTIKVNDATVATADVEASNGVIHVIDSVLLPPAADEEPTKNIVETAQSVDDLSTLVQAVIAADLVETLSGDGPFTVFAPTNEAFAALPEGTLDDLLKPENKDQLVKILTYHVVSGTVLSSDLADGDVPTLEGDTVKVMVDPITINGAGVVTPDVLATNGVVHVIDQVLLPPSEPTDDTPAEPTQSIVEIASGDDRFSTLVAALQAADLVDALSGDGPFTVFAPTNDAFAALGSTVDDLLKPENKEQLQQVLLYHVLGAEILSTDLTDGQEAETLQGGKVLARLDPVRINDANVIQADVLATNGVIHALDKVLIPCQDDASWHKKNEPAKDCAWVSQWAPRCNVKGEDNIRAWYGCPAACGTTCTDSGAWFKKGDDEKDCAWVASHPSEARCLVRGEDDTLAKDACPSACAPQ